jgi:hypothetical protein
MKKISALMGTIGMLFATNLYAAFDGSITLTQGSYSFSDGGEFTATTSGLGNLGTFQTFCIELNETFQPGTSYKYIMNSGAVTGDTGDDAYNQKPVSGPIATSGAFNMDNLSIGTAWLYSQFRANTLANYDFGATATHTQDAGALQDVFWYLEQEISYTQLTNGFNGASGALSKTYLNQAIAGTGTTTNTVFNDSNGKYGVIALNVYDTSGGLHQDQLAIVPEPTTIFAGALLLLPLGVGVLRILRKARAV